MAVALEFINVLVRIDAIRTKYPGGWERFLKDCEPRIGSIGWYDDHLYREGAMSPSDTEYLVEQWQLNGLQTHREEDGKPVEWLDICVTEMFGPTLACDWVAFTDDGRGAYLAGTEPGRLMTRKDFTAFDWATWCKNN